jgi:hypothetical protein
MKGRGLPSAAGGHDPPSLLPDHRAVSLTGCAAACASAARSSSSMARADISLARQPGLREPQDRGVRPRYPQGENALRLHGATPAPQRLPRSAGSHRRAVLRPRKHPPVLEPFGEVRCRRRGARRHPRRRSGLADASCGCATESCAVGASSDPPSGIPSIESAQHVGSRALQRFPPTAGQGLRSTVSSNSVI